jgi:2-C-methyl-D-erythritol 4-phosphate cytidylyltransferase
MKTTAIIVAAGSGTRFNSDTPKQFIEINRKPIIHHTIERFESARSVDEILLVLAEPFISTFAIGGYSKVRRVINGGETRAHSVFNGLNAITPDTTLVAVHDGARPFVSADEIERTIAKATETGAACLVAPITDTIKTISNNEIIATLDRSRLRRALTPQAFKTEVLKRAFEGTELDESITDECYLVEKLGHPISAVEGSPRNIKITTREDLLLAQTLMADV